MIYAHDMQGRFIYCNARAAEALGYDVADIDRLLGLSFFDILAPGTRAAGAALMGRG